MDLSPLSFPGCFVIPAKIVRDERGKFFKPFVRSDYEQHHLRTDFAEEFYTHSGKGVLRGMHFQLPPFEFFKLVACHFGRIRDVIVDLRAGSPTFQRCEVITLDAEDGKTLYLPPGIAHGFLVISDFAIVAYKTTCEYAVTHDSGILWDSLSIDWGLANPIVSARDLAFPALSEFDTPFTYQSEQASP